MSDLFKLLRILPPGERINRTQYIIAIVLLALLALFLFKVAPLIIVRILPLHYMLVLVLILIYLWIVAIFTCVLLVKTVKKRLHDIDYSGKYAYIIYLTLVMQLGLFLYDPTPHTFITPAVQHQIQLFVNYIMEIIIPIALLCLMVIKGTPGPNKYGLPPD